MATLIPSKVPLVVSIAYYSMFVFATIINPMSYKTTMNSFGIDVGKWTDQERFFSMSCYVSSGLIYMWFLLTAVSALQVGSEKARSWFLFSSGLIPLILAIPNAYEIYLGPDKELFAVLSPATQIPQYVLAGIIVILCFMGVDWTLLKPATCEKKPVYWGFWLVVPMYLFFFVNMRFAREAMLKSYGWKLEEMNPVAVAFGKMSMNEWADAILSDVLVMISIILAGDNLYTYACARNASLTFALGVGLCVGITFAQEYLGMHEAASGQKINVGMNAFFLLLFYIPVANQDSQPSMEVLASSPTRECCFVQVAKDAEGEAPLARVA